MVVGGSLSKTAAGVAAKAKSQVSNAVNAVLVVLTLLFLAPFFEDLPEAALAAIVIHALWHSASPRKLAPVRKVVRAEFWLAVLVLVAVLALDTLPAIALGVVISLLAVIYRVSFPRTDELRRDATTGAFGSAELHENREAIEGFVVYRFDAPLIYANATTFGAAARALVDDARPQASVLVVDCEEMFGIDFTGVEAVAGLVEDMRERDVDVRLTRVHRTVRERLDAGGVIATIGEDHVFTRIEDAIATGT
jgi:MFS superfamily sulfate permease-like transporter